MADATQVVQDLNCAAIYGLANWPGNVGIGTSSPLTKLHVAGPVLISPSGDGLRAMGLTVNSYASGAYSNGVDPQDSLRTLTLINGNSNTPIIFAMRNTNNGTFWNFVLDPNDGAKLKFARAGAQPTLTLASGNVGIGTTDPSATLYVNGSTILTQGYSTTSDERLKQDVQPIHGALKLVDRLEGVRYY